MLNLQQRITAIRQRLEPSEIAHPSAFLAAGIAAFNPCAGSSRRLVMARLRRRSRSAERRPSCAMSGSMAQATTLYDRNNRPGVYDFPGAPIETPLSEVSPHLVSAIISVEDQRFYEHSGIESRSDFPPPR
jgi:membrane peptidoglycan carboxypeptidase